MTIRQEVREALENSVHNAGPGAYTRDAVEVAKEILEYTTITDVTWETDEEYEKWVAQIAEHIREWQNG